MGDATDQVIAPIWKIYPATSYAEQYIINSRYCGNLLWQPGLTLQPPVNKPYHRRSAGRGRARVKQKRDEGSRQAGKRQFRLVAVRGMPYATSGLNRGKAG